MNEKVSTKSERQNSKNPAHLRDQRTRPQKGKMENQAKNTSKSKKDQSDFKEKFGDNGKRRSRKRTDKSSTNSDTLFVVSDIAGDKIASGLITDMIKCFTCNLQLPDNELEKLSANLYEKTISILLSILNACIEKVVKTLINNGHINKVFCDKTPLKKEVSCQTDIAGDVGSSNIIKVDN